MERRLEKLDKALGGQEPPRGRVAYADLTIWPDDARAAFLAADAAGDHDRVDDLVFEQTGIRPTRGGTHINLIVNHPIEELDPSKVTVEGQPYPQPNVQRVIADAVRADAERRETCLDADAKRPGRQMRRQRPTRKEVRGRRRRLDCSKSQPRPGLAGAPFGKASAQRSAPRHPTAWQW